MNNKGGKLNLFYPQWQGGGPDLSTYDGAHELKQNYCKGLSFTEIAVNRSEQKVNDHEIYQFDQIMFQTETARQVLDTLQPKIIFTIGGGCDAGILPASYLNHLLDSKLTLVWFDAHGDLNTPQTSPSGYLYGMPARTLLGEGEPRLLEKLYKPFKPEQLIMAGLRDLDRAEKEYLDRRLIKVLSVEALTKRPALIGETAEKFDHENIYIHLDLDVLDPDQFPHVPVPAPGGLAVPILSGIIKDLSANYNLCGLGIFEYSASPANYIDLLEQLCKIGAAL